MPWARHKAVLSACGQHRHIACYIARWHRYVAHAGRLLMTRYLLLATVLRLFSATPQMKALYRWLGNWLGARARIHRGLPPSYIERARLIWDSVDKHAIVPPGGRILELGTGWLQWESTLIRMRREDVRLTLYDIWDNRQLSALQSYFRQLAMLLGDAVQMAPDELTLARDLIERIGEVRSFQDLYAELGFEHIIEPSGQLTRFPDAHFDAIISYNVLEHVDVGILPGYVCDLGRILKPGGYSVQKIDVGDHLAYYFGGLSKKSYLRYSERTWRRWFENEVQYFNRVQRSEWMDLFRDAGLELVEENTQLTNIDAMTVAPQFVGLDKRDLACVGFRVIHCKPL